MHLAVFSPRPVVQTEEMPLRAHVPVLTCHPALGRPSGAAGWSPQAHKPRCQSLGRRPQSLWGSPREERGQELLSAARRLHGHLRSEKAGHFPSTCAESVLLKGHGFWSRLTGLKSSPPSPISCLTLGELLDLLDLCWKNWTMAIISFTGL